MYTPLIIRIAVFLIFILAWEAVCRLGFVNHVLLAAPTEIAMVLVVDGGKFAGAFRTTLIEIAIAIGITWPLGIMIGMLAGSIPRVGRAAGPLLSSAFAIPLIIWYPLFVVWFGLGSASKIMFGVIGGFFPIAMNAMAGVRLFDRQLLLLGRSIGATRFQIIARILLPWALPSIISGLRTGTALIVVGVVVAEMIAALGGLGYWITYYRATFATAHVYLGIVLALVSVLLVNGGLSLLEKKFGAWRELERSNH